MESKTTVQPTIAQQRPDVRDLCWQSDAQLEYIDSQGDKVLYKKINNLIKDALWNGYQAGSGKLGLLKGNIPGHASVHFDKKLSVEAATAIIHEMQRHYGNIL